MGVSNAAIAALLAKAKARNEQIKKEGYSSAFYQLRNIADGETVEIKMLLPTDGQPLFSEVLYVQTGEGEKFRSYLSQNFPFEIDGQCVLCEAIEQVSQDPESRAQHATVLQSIKRVKRLVYPVLVLNVETDETTGEVLKYTVRDNEVKFLELTPNQSTDLLSLINERAAKNADGGVYSLKLGKNVSISRTGKGKNDTKYRFALSEPIVLNEADAKKFGVPVDVEEYIKTQILDEDKMNEVVVKLFS